MATVSKPPLPFFLRLMTIRSPVSMAQLGECRLFKRVVPSSVLNLTSKLIWLHIKAETFQTKTDFFLIHRNFSALLSKVFSFHMERSLEITVNRIRGWKFEYWYNSLGKIIKTTILNWFWLVYCSNLQDFVLNTSKGQGKILTISISFVS